MMSASRLVVETSGSCIRPPRLHCHSRRRGNYLEMDLILIHYRMVVGIDLNILLLVSLLRHMVLVPALDLMWMTKEE